MLFYTIGTGGNLTDTEQVYVRSMGKALRVVAIFSNEEDANRFMHSHSEAAVVAVLKNGLILLADKYDHGEVTPCPA